MPAPTIAGFACAACAPSGFAFSSNTNPPSTSRPGFGIAPRSGRSSTPPFPAPPGHELWKRDFSGACSLFGVVFEPEWTAAAVNAFIDRLELFGIGSSWGGFESLAIPTYGTITRTAGSGRFGGLGVRIHIGLEDVADLIADLEHGFAALHRHRRA